DSPLEFEPVTLARNEKADFRPGVSRLRARIARRGGSPREGARSELASGAATGGGGPQAPPTRTQCIATGGGGPVRAISAPPLRARVGHLQPARRPDGPGNLAG